MPLRKEDDRILHSFISCFSSGSRASLEKPGFWARGASLKFKRDGGSFLGVGEIDSRWSPWVRYSVLQMGVAVFEEADLVFCCCTSQKMKRKTPPLALQGTGVAFASFADHVSDIPWCLLKCPRSLCQQREENRDAPSLWSTCLLLKYSQQMRAGTHHKACHHLGQTLEYHRLLLLLLQLKKQIIWGDLLPV